MLREHIAQEQKNEWMSFSPERGREGFFVLCRVSWMPILIEIDRVTEGVGGMKKISAGHVVARSLEACGTDTVFGIPGMHTLDIYDGLSESSLRVVTARHEQGAGFMADGYARSTGRVGVVLVTSGPGLTNVLTPMGQAFSDAVPLLVISSQIPRAFLAGRSGFLHEMRNSTIMVSSVAKESRCICTAEEIPHAVEHAMRTAVSGRPGPVHLEIPLDVLGAEMDGSSLLVWPGFAASGRDPKSAPPGATGFSGPPGSSPPESDLAAAISLLHNASNPLILAGGGARTATREIRDLSERLGAPIVTTAAGKGILPETHPLSLGTRLHFPSVRNAIEKADVLLAVGTELAPTDFWETAFHPSGALIRVDTDPSALSRNVPASVALEGDAGKTLFHLLAGLDMRRLPRSEETAELIRRSRNELASVTRMGGALPFMLEMLRGLRRGFPEEGLLAMDMTGPAYVALSEFPVLHARTFLHPVGFGTLGYALPAAIGAKLAAPERPVCAFTGDGGFQFTLPELAVACQEELSLPVVVWDNGGYGEIRRNQEARCPGRYLGVDLFGPDLERLAASYDIPGISISSEDGLAEAVAVALERRIPTLIRVDAGREV